MIHKFRAWSKCFNSFLNITGFECINGEISGIFHDGDYIGYDKDDIVLTQYTGLKDKNGKEIYEGDILRGHGNDKDLAQVCLGNFYVINVETLAKVDEIHGWYTKVLPTDEISKIEPFCLDMPLTDFYIDRAEYEIIGNIYENPELLNLEP